MPTPIRGRDIILTDEAWKAIRFASPADVRPADTRLGHILPYITELDAAYIRLADPETERGDDLAFFSPDASYLPNVFDRKRRVLKSVPRSRQRNEVRRVYAPFIVAPVMKVECVGDGSMTYFPKVLVNENRHPVDLDAAISEGVFGTGPFPATGFSVHGNETGQVVLSFVAKHVAKRLSLYPVLCGVSSFGDIRSLSTTALTKTIGDVWGTLWAHCRLLSCTAMPPAAPTARGSFVPKLYQKTSVIMGVLA